MTLQIYSRRSSITHSEYYDDPCAILVVILRSFVCLFVMMRWYYLRESFLYPVGNHVPKNPSGNRGWKGE